MEIKKPTNFQTFYSFVFGDYRNYYFNGLPEDIFTSLEGFERIEAEKLVVQAIKKIIMDERAIRAAGYLKLQVAVPILEKRLAPRGIFMRQTIYSSVTWALLKIKSDKKCLGKIIGVVKNSSKVEGLTRPDAADLLSDYGQDPSIIDALFYAYKDNDDFRLSSIALASLRKIFKDNADISEILKRNYYSSLDKNSIITRVKISLGY